MTLTKPLTQRKAWKALASHQKKIQKLHLRELFAKDSDRGTRMTVEAAGLFLDYSKNRVTNETLRLLISLAKESNLPSRIKAMFSGEKINITENRAGLHTALRAPKSATILVDGKTSCRTCMRFSTRWPPLPVVCAAAIGKATRVNAFAIS